MLARRFRIVRFIARGGMGEVYEAEDVELGDRVALKAIRRRVDPSGDLRALFKREVQMARRVTHPNVCRIFDMAQHDSGRNEEPVLLLSMELIDGETLTDYLKRKGPLSHESALPLIEDIAAGLQAVHDAGIIHGDLKPGNVMLATPPGETAQRARVMDFGMAFSANENAPSNSSEADTAPFSELSGQRTVTLRAGVRGFAGGTPDYFAPEQTNGAPATAATDVYAFALVIGEMLGVPRTDRLAPGAEHMPGAWSRLLRRCLSNDPRRRYSRPADLARALRAALEGRLRTRRAALITVGGALTVALAARRIDVILRGTANGLIMTENSAETVEYPSPDGRYLAGTSWDTGDLILHDVSSGKLRRLTHKTASVDSSFGGAFGALFSPDGQRVAFTWAKSRDEVEIRIIGVEGKGERTLYRVTDGAWPALLDWSPDGGRILFSVAATGAEGERVSTVEVADGRVQLVGPAFQGHTVFGADGSSFVFDSKGAQGTWAIRRRLANGTESILVGAPGSNQAIGWSPDRRRLIFSSDRRGQAGIWAVAVSERGAEGEPQELAPSSKGWEPLGITRAGALFYRQDASTLDVYTAVLDLGAGKTMTAPRRVTERFIGAYSGPNWSEDGRRLVFTSTRERPGSALVVYDAPASQIREIQVDLQFAARPQWVEHGAAIMVMGRSQNGPTGLYRVDARTGQASLFRSGRDLETTFEGAWSRDGRFHFNRFQDFRRGLFRLDLSSGERRILYVPPPGIAMGLENLALSPDGRTLAFHIHNEAGGTSSLMLVPTEGGAARPLFTVQAPRHFLYGSFTWTPDSQSLLAASSRNVGNPKGEDQQSELWLSNLDGSPARKIDFPAMGVLCLRLNPDGKTIAFHSRKNKSEIWVLQKFL